MEALTAVSVAALTVYDMCKAVAKEAEICNIHLVRKSGGKSGDFVRQTASSVMAAGLSQSVFTPLMRLHSPLVCVLARIILQAWFQAQKTSRRCKLCLISTISAPTGMR